MTKPRWDWKSKDCILAYVEAAEACDSHYKVASKLALKFDPSNSKFKKVTASVFIGAMHRGALLKALKQFAPDKTYLAEKFTGTKSQLKKRPKKASGSRSIKIPGPPKLKPERIRTGPPSEREARKQEIRDLQPVHLENGRPATVQSLNESMCRYPIGEPSSPDFGYCGRGICRGQYCMDHAELIYEPSKKKKKAEIDNRLRDAINSL